MMNQDLCPRLDEAHDFGDGEMAEEARAAFRWHLRACGQCRDALTEDAVLGALFRRGYRRMAEKERDHARELLEVAIGLGGLAWWVIDDAAWWAFRRVVWAVLPAPVKEYVRWQGASARVTTRWE